MKYHIFKNAIGSWTAHDFGYKKRTIINETLIEVILELFSIYINCIISIYLTSEVSIILLINEN